MCHLCTAGTGRERFYYKALANQPPHPYLAQTASASKQAASNRREGLRTERKVLGSIDNTRFTANSGARHGDGDAITYVPEMRLHTEHKTRIANRNRLGPTTQEWDKAQARGIDVFITTSDQGSIVTMTLETYQQLIQLANSSHDHNA